MDIDRAIAKKSLTDGFCLLYGEQYRDLLDSVGEKIIEKGIRNGRRFFNLMALDKITQSHLHIYIDCFEKNEKIDSVEALKIKLLKDLKPFAPQKLIEKGFKEQPYNPFSEANFAYTTGTKALFKSISKVLTKVKPIPVKSIPSFNYFKQFPVYAIHKSSVTLATEGGLGLDQFNYPSVKYYLEESEDFYLAESIPYKYHQLGSILIKEELRLKFIDKIKKNINSDTYPSIKSLLRSMARCYCFHSEEDDTLLDIQSVCGEAGFSTSGQLQKYLKESSK